MKGTEKNRDPAAKDVLEQLFQHATERVRPAREAEEAVRAALHTEWRKMTARRRLSVPLAAAASIALVVFAVFSLQNDPVEVVPSRTLATVEIATGNVIGETRGKPGSKLLVASDPVYSGQRIFSQADSRLAIRWLDGSSVRLDHNTDLQLTDGGEIRLLTGRLYVDTSDTRIGPDEFAILTPAGRVQHLGTQYMAAVAAVGTTITVRQGRVRLDGAAEALEAEAGQQLQVDASGFSERQAIPIYGDLWQWTQGVAPVFASDGRLLSDFLDWVSRETGRSIRFASAEIRKRAEQTQIHGQFDMQPMQALAAVLKTSDLSYEALDGTLLIHPDDGR